MRTSLSVRCSMGRLAIAAAVILFGIVVFASEALPHGDEPHEESSTDTALVAESLDSSASATMDSILTVIGEGFEALRPTFERGCFDCHSSSTNYPWYYKLPMVKGMIDDDIREAMKHLDMTSGFPFEGHGRPADDLLSIMDVVVDGDMPPWKYRLMHWGAGPSLPESDSIAHWVYRSLKALASHGEYPFGRADLVPDSPLKSGSEDRPHGDH